MNNVNKNLTNKLPITLFRRIVGTKMQNETFVTKCTYIQKLSNFMEKPEICRPVHFHKFCSSAQNSEHRRTLVSLPVPSSFSILLCSRLMPFSLYLKLSIPLGALLLFSLLDTSLPRGPNHRFSSCPQTALKVKVLAFRHLSVLKPQC